MTSNTIERDSESNEALRVNAVDDVAMLRNAERHIEKLTIELKDKDAQIEHHLKRWQFYEQIVKNLTTFKG